jgi:hypothetical protein
MSVTSLTRYNGGKRDAMVALAKKAKPIHQKSGAELLRLGQIHTGPHAGQWVVSVRYPDWEAYGKARQALAGDTAYQKLTAEVEAVNGGARLRNSSGFSSPARRSP